MYVWSREFKYFILILSIFAILYIYYSITITKEAHYTGFRLLDDNDDILQTNNTNKLFNINFNYMIKSKVCAVIPTNIINVIIVTSYFGNVETRSAMRRAFSTEELANLNFIRVFLLAKGSRDKYTGQKAIEDEAERFGDIVQGNFDEAYKNLTYKHLMGLLWASEECKNARFIIKMDDDIVVDIHKLKSLTYSTQLVGDKLLAGYIMDNMVPIREKANKWYVSKLEYEDNFYPTFLSGWLYITNVDTARKLINISNKYPYFWIDDLFITGILAKEYKIVHQRLNKYFTPHPEFLQCCMRDVEKTNTDCDYLVGPNGGDSNLFYKFNQIVGKCAIQRCKKRIKSLSETCVAERKFSVGKGDGIIQKYRLV